MSDIEISGSFSSIEAKPDEASPAELIRQAEQFEERLRALGSEDASLSLDPSRIARVLKLLNATLVPCTTRSQNTTNDGKPAINVPATIGRFTVGELLGEGGFGAVYKAHDTVLHRDVALKAVPRRASLDTNSDDYRLREARAAARLSHPSLVPLYEVFEDDQYLYLISELCDGPTLAEYLARTGEPVTPAWAVEITLRLAQAIAHVHGRGLVHRDIKPSNVLLAPERSESDLLPFTPRLTDFGLVLDTDNDPVEIDRHRLVGTILYLPPEQLLGSGGVDARSGDVYTLGLLLYEMLAGELPYRSSNAIQRFEEICRLPIPRIETNTHPISADLHSIYLKALAKRPEDRYASAQMLANDLARYRDGQEVSARRQSNLERTYRAIRRAPLLSGLLVAFVLLALSSAAVYGWNNRLLREQSHELKEALTAASASRSQAIQAAYLSDMNQAFVAVSKEDPATAISFIKEIRKYSEERQQNRFDLRLLETIAGKGWTHLDPLGAAVEEIVPLPNSNRFVVAGGNQVRVYDPDRPQPIREIVLEDPGESIHALAVAADGERLAIGVSGVSLSIPWLNFHHRASSVRFVSLSDSPVPHPLMGFDATVDSLAFSDDGKRLAVGSRYEPPLVFDLEGDSSPLFLPGTRRNEDLIWGPDDELTWLAEADEVRVHDARSDAEVSRFKVIENYVFRRLHRSADGRWIAATLRERSGGLLYDCSHPTKPPALLRMQQGELHSIRISPSGDFVTAGGMDGGVAVWDIADVERDQEKQEIGLQKYQSIHGSSVVAIGVNHAGVILSGSTDGSLAATSIDAKGNLRQQHRMDDPSSVADLSPDGRTALVGCFDGSVWKVDLSSRTQTRIHDPTGFLVESIAISPDGHYVAVAWCNARSEIGTVESQPIWHTLPNRGLGEVALKGARHLAFNSNSTRLLIRYGTHDFQWVDLTDPKSGEANGRSTGQEIVANAAASYHSPNGVNAAAILSDDTVVLIGESIRIWSKKTNEIASVKEGIGYARCQCTDANLQAIYVGCGDGRIRKLSLDGDLLATSPRWAPMVASLKTSQPITAIALSPDSRSLLTGSDVGHLGIWDAKTLRYLGPVWEADFASEIDRIRVSPEGDLIFVHQRRPPSLAPESNGQLQWLSLKK